MEWNANIWVLIFKMSMVVMKLVTWKIQKRTQSTVALVSKTSNLTLTVTIPSELPPHDSAWHWSAKIDVFTYYA